MKNGDRSLGSHRFTWLGHLCGILVATLAVSGCDNPVEHDGPIAVACDAPSPADTTAIHVVLADEARIGGGRILVRVDSLASQVGPIFDSPTGFLIQAFAAVGPGYGCASIIPVGATVSGPGHSLERAWIHVKTDLPVHVIVESQEGRVITQVVAEPGTLVEPLTWEPDPGPAS